MANTYFFDTPNIYPNIYQDITFGTSWADELKLSYNKIRERKFYTVNKAILKSYIENIYVFILWIEKDFDLINNNTVIGYSNSWGGCPYANYIKSVYKDLTHICVNTIEITFNSEKYGYLSYPTPEWAKEFILKCDNLTDVNNPKLIPLPITKSQALYYLMNTLI